MKDSHKCCAPPEKKRYSAARTGPPLRDPRAVGVGLQTSEEPDTRVAECGVGVAPGRCSSFHDRSCSRPWRCARPGPS